MYNFKCDKRFNKKLNLPNVSFRYSNVFNSSKKNIIIVKEQFDDPTWRYRGYNIVQTMENNDKYDVNCFLVKELELLMDILDKIDLVIIQRALWSFEIESFINLIKNKGITVLYDVDDLIYNTKFVPKYLINIGDTSNSMIERFFAVVKRYEVIANMCDGYIVTTEKLYENIKNDFDKPVWIFHNYLNKEQESISKEVINLKEKSYSNEKFIIGYFSGSDSHKRDLEIVESALIKLIDKYDNIYLKIVGIMELSNEFKKLKNKGKIIVSDFVPYEELQYEIGKVDLNIVPLQNNEFNDCKSELKYFEASIVNTLTCASNNQVYGSVIDDGVDGFLADEMSWFDKIEYIYLNQYNLVDIVENAKNKCLNEYGNKQQEKSLEIMYNDIFEFFSK